ncbi:MAG: MBOAT family protein [Clostridia bacterium]|nr:MBOAT family protein [Clostridia bacterium]
MLFSSYEFVFAFLPITAAVYFLLSKIKNPYPQRAFLAAASLFFYSYFEWSYFLIISGSIVVNFIVAKISLCGKSKVLKKALLVLSVLFNVGLIGYYKYYDFAVDTFNTVASADIPLKGILIPLGISFFTFQQLSFQLRTYRTDEKKLNFIDYTLFVSFFPQLIAGPIVLYDELVPQIADGEKRFLNKENLATGFSVFTYGLFKKLIIADELALIVDNGFAASKPMGMIPMWVVALAYTFQIYFDFSGYSEMAIGLGKMFNFELPVNFCTPLRSASITEMWQRWHITLGRTLSELVYIPLGGNRKGKLRKKINLFIVFLVSGIWHGASWTFVLWGVAHGAARVIEECFPKLLSKIPVFIRRAFTFIYVVLAFVIFRATSVAQAGRIFGQLFDFTDLGLDSFKKLLINGIFGMPNIVAMALAFAAVAICFIVMLKEKSTSEILEDFKLTPKRAVITALMLAVCVLCMSRSAVFIYFNF